MLLAPPATWGQDGWQSDSEALQRFQHEVVSLRTMRPPLSVALCGVLFNPEVLWSGFGVERCTLSTGVRVGIAIASIVACLIVLIVIRSMRGRATRRTNLMYVGTTPANGAVPPPGQAPPAYPAPGPNGYYNATPGTGYAPQYPPQSYNPQSPYTSPYPVPGNLPQYAPPSGPPPAQGGLPQYAPPPGPPPAQGGPPQYAPPPGAPPGTEQKEAV
ncbi:hypothetical protein ONZ51_g11882 [Trametes cubensis]|uniref:Uncharacterized protein n=1 Tax=Trametes cubensis TaxID=1111947 RepID=A0AAD7X7F1_9APHY|nr:hypothetical protein ONZ51_g11882 [Trametes cubensis]